MKVRVDMKMIYYSKMCENVQKLCFTWRHSHKSCSLDKLLIFCSYFIGTSFKAVVFTVPLKLNEMSHRLFFLVPFMLMNVWMTFLANFLLQLNVSVDNSCIWKVGSGGKTRHASTTNYKWKGGQSWLWWLFGGLSCDDNWKIRLADSKLKTDKGRRI